MDTDKDGDDHVRLLICLSDVTLFAEQVDYELSMCVQLLASAQTSPSGWED